MRLRFFCYSQFPYEILIFLFIHRTVDIIRCSLIITGSEERGIHIDRIRRNDRRHRIKEMQRELRTGLLDLLRQRIAGKRAGGNNDISIRYLGHFTMLHRDIWVVLQMFCNKTGKTFPVHGQSTAGRDFCCVRTLHDQRAHPTHLFLQQANCIAQFIGAKRIGTDQFRKQRRLMCLRKMIRLHIDQSDRDMSAGKLPGAFRSCQSRSYNNNIIYHSSE